MNDSSWYLAIIFLLAGLVVTGLVIFFRREQPLKNEPKPFQTPKPVARPAPAARTAGDPHPNGTAPDQGGPPIRNSPGEIGEPGIRRPNHLPSRRGRKSAAPGGHPGRLPERQPRQAPVHDPAPAGHPVHERTPQVPSGPRPGQKIADGYDYDVYISYDPTDQAWVEAELLPRLASAALRVAIAQQAQDGLEPVKELGESLQCSRRLVAVVSPAYLANHHARLEAFLAQRAELRKGAMRFIPLVILPIDLPPMLGRHLPVDLTTPGLRSHRLNLMVDFLTEPLNQE